MTSLEGSDVAATHFREISEKVFRNEASHMVEMEDFQIQKSHVRKVIQRNIVHADAPNPWIMGEIDGGQWVTSNAEFFQHGIGRQIDCAQLVVIQVAAAQDRVARQIDLVNAAMAPVSLCNELLQLRHLFDAGERNDGIGADLDPPDMLRFRQGQYFILVRVEVGKDVATEYGVGDIDDIRTLVGAEADAFRRDDLIAVGEEGLHAVFAVCRQALDVRQ